jgi:hypothetical protein
VAPAAPVGPTAPVAPLSPFGPCGPAGPSCPTGPGAPGRPATMIDVTPADTPAEMAIMAINAMANAVLDFAIFSMSSHLSFGLN